MPAYSSNGTGRSSTRRSLINNDPNAAVNATPFHSSMIGVNGGDTSDYAGFAWFTNHIRDSRAFGNMQNGQPITNIDANGWPLNDQWQTVLSAGNMTTMRVGILALGTYYCRYETDPGVVNAIALTGNDCHISSDVVQPDGITHLFTLVVTGYTVIINGANGAPVRNIVIPANEYGFTLANYDTRMFLPWLTKFRRQFTGTREMQLCSPNGFGYTPPFFGDWANVKTKDTKHTHGDLTAAGGALSLDLIVQLVNETRQEPGSRTEYVWFNMMHNADDNYITQYLTYVRDSVNPNLQIYIELSNETWNYTFSAAPYFLNEGLGNISNYGLDYDGTTDANHMRMRAYAHRCVFVSQQIDLVWAGVTDRPKARMVLGGMWASPVYIDSMVGYIEHFTGLPFNQTFYCIAFAPYFGVSLPWNDPANAPLPGPPTVQDIIDRFHQSADGMIDGEYTWNFTRQGMRYNKSQAVEYQCKLFCYEGGWDLGGAISNDYMPIVNQAFNDPQMAGVVYHYLDNMMRTGVDQFNWFTSGPAIWYDNNLTYAITDSTDVLKPPLLGFTQRGNARLPNPSEILHPNHLSPVIGVTTALDTKHTTRGTYYLPSELAAFAASGENRVVTWDGPYQNPGFIRSDFYTGEKRWLNWTIYVEVAGNYDIVMMGSGGSYTGSGVSKVYDPANDAYFRWEYYYRRPEDAADAFTLLGYADPCLGGSLDNPQACKTVVNGFLPQGWLTFRLTGNAQGVDPSGNPVPYPPGVVYQTDSDGALVMDPVTGGPVILSSKPGSQSKNFWRINITRTS